MGWIIGAYAWIRGRAVVALALLTVAMGIVIKWMHARMQEKDRRIARSQSYIETTKRIVNEDSITDADDATEWLQERQDARKD